MHDLWRLSATDLSALIRDRKVSAREAAVAGLARLDAVNPAINAVVDHRPEETLARADAIDAAIARGDNVGPLGGDAFKKWYKAFTGKDCGCGDRQHNFNQQYPYQHEPQTAHLDLSTGPR